MRYEQVTRFSPEALGLMEFNSQASADVAGKIYGNHPVLGASKQGTWNAVLSQEYNMTSDRGLFNEDEDGYPLYEGKMVAAFDHRYASPSYWMKADIALSGRTHELLARATPPAPQTRPSRPRNVSGRLSAYRGKHE